MLMPMFMFTLLCYGLFILRKFSYLLDLSLPKIITKITTENAQYCLEKYCKDGNYLKVVDICDKCIINNIPINILNGLCIACTNGHLLISIYLWDLCYYNGTLDNIIYLMDAMFRNSCIDGHINISEWLYKMSILSGYKININKEYIFKNLCINQEIDCAIWFYKFMKKIKDPVDIHLNNNELFITCCQNNNFRSFKFLYKFGKRIGQSFDIAMHNHMLFRIVCENNYYEIASWLRKKNPNQYKLITNCNYSSCLFGKLFNIKSLHKCSIIDWIILDEIHKAYEYLQKNDIKQMINILQIKNYKITNRKRKCCICFEKVDCYFKVCNFSHYHCIDCLLKWIKMKGILKCVMCKQFFEWNTIDLFYNIK